MITNAIGLSTPANSSDCVPHSPPIPAPPSSPPTTVYVGVHDAYAAFGGPATAQTGPVRWNATSCSCAGWHGASTGGELGDWVALGDDSEAWANGVSGSSTAIFWWTAGTRILSPHYIYKVYADIDTCNAGSTAAWYTLAGNDGTDHFNSQDSGQRNTEVNQAETNGYALLGEEETGESGITVAVVNGGGIDGRVGVEDIKLVRGAAVKTCRTKEPCAE